MSISKVLVVGGGIGGLTAAIAFRRQGIAVDLVEINSTWKVYHVGIIVQANTIRAMKAIGLADRLVAAGFPYRGVEVCNAAGECQSHVQGARIAGEEYPSDLGITRPKLHEVLIESAREAGANLRLGQTWTALDDDGEQVHASFTDGSRESYDLVVGADGVYSKLRTHLFGDHLKPKFTGQGVWRYNVPRPAEVDVGALYIGKDTKAGYVPLTQDTMYILLVTPEPGNPQMPQAELADIMRERLAEYGGIVGEARDRYIVAGDQVVYRPLEAILVDAPWYKGRIVLLGDAVHATSPHLGQGAAQAVEDAVVLAEEAGSGKSVDDALAGYMARRFERCKFINQASLQIGEWELTHDPAADHAGIRRKMLEVVAQPL